MKSVAMLNTAILGFVVVACVMTTASVGVAAEPSGSSLGDFAYRQQVRGTSDAAAYRVTLPLALYQKIAHPDLSDVRVFNGSGEQVPFAIERPVAGTVTSAATALPLFPLKVDSSETPDALRVTIESGRSAINLQAGGQGSPADRTTTYLVDGRVLDVPVAALRLDWPEGAADFAGRMKVEASEDLADWRNVMGAAPVANLHANAQRLVEQRLEFSPNKAKYWRLSWIGTPAPFVLTSVFAEPAKQNVDARHVSMTVSARKLSKSTPGEFEYDLRARVPVDRVNLELPDVNTVVEVELLSRPWTSEAWRMVRRGGFYRLNNDGVELRNGSIPVQLDSDSHWLLRTDPQRGGLGNAAPRLTVQWVPHELVFVARGAGPFSIAYGSASVDTTAAVSLSLLPKNLSISSAVLSDRDVVGGDDRLKPPPAPYAWKAALLWIVLIASAALMAWMAFRLSQDVKRP
jgi:hypothetical protein